MGDRAVRGAVVLHDMCMNTCVFPCAVDWLWKHGMFTACIGSLLSHTVYQQQRQWPGCGQPKAWQGMYVHTVWTALVSSTWAACFLSVHANFLHAFKFVSRNLLLRSIMSHYSCIIVVVNSVEHILYVFLCINVVLPYKIDPDNAPHGNIW